MTSAGAGVPLVVNLDGTFLRGDTLRLMALRLAVRRPGRIWGAVLSLRDGRAALKTYLWTHSGLSVGGLRVSARLSEWLAREASTGRPIHLVTGAPQPLADAIAREWPIFDGALGSTSGHNLTGARKAAALVARFGEEGFDYVGNARADLAVWRRARHTIVCNARPRVLGAARLHHPEALEIRDDRRRRLRPRRDLVEAHDLSGVRVLMALYYYAPYTSGLTVYAQRLAEDLAARGAHVDVVTTRHRRALPSRERIRGVYVHRARPLVRIDKGVVAPGFLINAIRLGRRADVVVPVLPLAEAGLLSLLVPRRRLLPLYICDLRLGSGRLSRAIERVSALAAHLAVSRARRHCVLSLDYARASRVVGDLVGRAIEAPPPVDAWRYQRRPSGELATRLGIGDRRVVGFVGRVVFEKGLPVLLEAMRAVRSAHPDVALVLAGESEDVAGGGILHELRRRIDGDASIIVTGRLSDDDLLAFYSLCSVVALPSVDALEAFGMVQVEAMLCGTPVVASDLPGVRLPVLTTGMGRLCPPGDAVALAAALTDVLADPSAFRVPRESVERAFDPATSYQAVARAVAETAG